MTAQARPEHRIDPERLEEAMRRAGIKNKAKLAKAAGVWPSNVKRWLDGDTTPAGDTLSRLCTVLGVRPGYLFGQVEQSQTAEIDRLLAEVERVMGRSSRDALRSLSKLTPHHRTIATGRLEGWIQALAEVEAATGKMPLTQFEVDEAELRAATAGERSESVGPSR